MKLVYSAEAIQDLVRLREFIAVGQSYRESVRVS